MKVAENKAALPYGMLSTSEAAQVALNTRQPFVKLFSGQAILGCFVSTECL